MNQDGLRVFVDAVGRDVAQVTRSTPPKDSASVAALAGSWAKLVEFLALGPTPEQRECPHCGSVGMRAATLCGTCWSKLVPPQQSPAEAR